MFDRRIVAILAICLVILSAGTGAMAKPGVSTLNGRLLDGQSFSITGTETGPGSTVLSWDDFETGSLGASINGRNPILGHQWYSTHGGTPTDPNHAITYQNQRVYSGGRSLRVWFANKSENTTILYFGWKDLGPYPELYTTYMRYNDPRHADGTVDNTIPNNYKQGYTFGASPPTREPSLMTGAILPSSNPPYRRHHWQLSWQGDGYTHESMTDPWISYEQTNHTWQRWEVYHRMNTWVSDLNPRQDGQNTMRIIDRSLGTIVADSTGLAFGNHDTAQCRRWNLGYMWQGQASVDTARTFYDDVFVADNRSRVEIGNNADFAACTKRDIQPHISWANNTITVQVHVPSFAVGENAHLFIIDNNGEVSVSKPIVIGNQYSPEPDNEDPVIEVDEVGLPIWANPEDSLPPPHYAQISGTASDNVGLRSVTWTNSLGGSGTASGLENWTAQVSLFYGTNVITFTATDTSGRTGTAVHQEEWAFPGPVPSSGPITSDD